MNLGDFTTDWKPQTITRNDGSTDAERYLQRLCDRSFLSLWSYAGLFRDQMGSDKGDGKELADLLTVCGNDVLIFSDKSCGFPNTGDIGVDWSRWFRSAIKKSADQAFGAGRWIKEHPDRIFLDRACTTRFPIHLPPSDRLRISYVVVAHNVSARCAGHFPGSSGTLMIDSSLIGPDPAQPFVVGWLDKVRPFVHILEDESLDIVLSTCDTFTDFVKYLHWKEALFSSAKERSINILCCGEEDLLGEYLLSMTNKGHGFALPDEPINCLLLEEGIWKRFLQSPQRAAQVRANEDSYFWDYLIEKFCKNILKGTSYDRVTPFIADREKAVRMLALEPRTHRRLLARGLIELLHKTAPNVRATRVVRPEGRSGPYFCFLLLPRYTSIPTEIYREARGQNLEALLRVTKFLHPDALDIVGIATESGPSPDYRSEDLMYLDARNWSAEEQEHARQLQKNLNILASTTFVHTQDFDYPVDEPRKDNRPPHGLHLEKNPRNKLCPCGSGKKYKKCHGR